MVLDSEADPSSSAHTGQKKKWNDVERHTSGRDFLGLVLCVAGLLLPLTPDLPTLPGFFQYTELYCCFTLRATQLNICIGFKIFFLFFCWVFFAPNAVFFAPNARNS